MPFLKDIPNTATGSIGPSVYYSASDPGTALGAGKLWYDGTNLSLRNQANSGWSWQLDISAIAAGATEAYVDAAIAALVGTAPGVLNTLGEISDALNDDANLYTTLTTALAAKAPLASPTFTGTPTVPDDAYDATTWNGNPGIPTKNAVRDKIEALGSGGISATIVDAKGDLIAGTANDTVARVAVGTNGKVLTADSTATAGVSWQTPSAGGSVKYSRWDPFVPDASPHALNQEFDSSSLAAFTTVNTGTDGFAQDADTTAAGALFHNTPNQQYRIRADLLTLPGDTNYTIHTAVNAAIWYGGGSLLSEGGLLLSTTNTTNTGSQRKIGLGITSAAPYMTRNYGEWNVFGESASGASVNTYTWGGGSFVFLRHRRQSGSSFAAWSADGETWWEIGLTLGITPAYFGCYSQNYSTFAAQFSFPFLRYYANGTQYKTGALVNVLG